MDRHIVPGITLKDASEAHKLDVAIQDEFDCKAITFWLDEDRGCAFCLIEAPDEESVRDLHNKAHGLIPNEIIEVEKNLVESFLGRLSDPEPVRLNAQDPDMIIYDPAYRVIMEIKIKDAPLMITRLGKTRGNALFEDINNRIDTSLYRYEGRQVFKRSDGCMASFSSVVDSVKCAIDIRNRLEQNSNLEESKIHVAIGLSGGDPVTGEKPMFEEATQLAHHLCCLSAERGDIILSSEITEKLGVNHLQKFSGDHTIRALSMLEERFFSTLMEVMETKWDDPHITLSDVCKQAGFSRSMLYRKLTALTGKSFVDFLKEFRLNRALTLLEKNKDNITRAAYESGFSNPSYFAKCFREKFGLLPSEFARSYS